MLRLLTSATAAAVLTIATASTVLADEAEGVVQLVGHRVSCDAGCAPSCDAPSCDAPSCDAPSYGESCDSGRCGNGGSGCRNGLCGRGGAGGLGRGMGGHGMGGHGMGGRCGDGTLAGWWACQKAMHRHRNTHAAAQMKGYFASKFGYFCPSANCGQGMGLVTKYGMVYSLDPNYADARDGERYAAPGQGVHLNVPLAPNVRHSYNYGWGIPSSRLTPVRHGAVVGPPQPAPIHGF